MEAADGLEPRAEKRRARDGVIRVLVGDRPALPLCERAADPELIGDGCIALIVRGVPRVDRDLHGFTSMDSRRDAAQLGLEDLPCRLPREHSHNSANRVVASRVDRRRRNAATRSRKTSSSLASFASSFGHDTPAHVERRFVVLGVRDGDEWAAQSAAPNALCWCRARKMGSAQRSRGITASAIESICLNRDAVGTMPSSVIPKRSTSDDVEDVPCGTSEMF